MSATAFKPLAWHKALFLGLFALYVAVLFAGEASAECWAHGNMRLPNQIFKATPCYQGERGSKKDRRSLGLEIEPFGRAAPHAELSERAAALRSLAETLAAVGVDDADADADAAEKRQDEGGYCVACNGSSCQTCPKDQQCGFDGEMGQYVCEY